MPDTMLVEGNANVPLTEGDPSTKLVGGEIKFVLPDAKLLQSSDFGVHSIHTWKGRDVESVMPVLPIDKSRLDAAFKLPSSCRAMDVKTLD